MKKLTGSLYKEGETATNYNDSDYVELPIGAYVCKIVEVEDKEEWSSLAIYLDIAEGDYKGYFEKIYERTGAWVCRVFAKYTDRASSLFKKFCKAVNASNPGYLFNPFEDGTNADERTLIDKQVGMVFHIEEYRKADGSLGAVRTGQFPGFIRIEAAREGKFNQKLLERKELPTETPKTVPGFVAVNEDVVEGIQFN